MVEKSLEVRKRVGYLPETVPLYTDMTVTNYLKYMGTLRGMPGSRIRTRISDVIDVCRLGDLIARRRSASSPRGSGSVSESPRP